MILVRILGISFDGSARVCVQVEPRCSGGKRHAALCKTLVSTLFDLKSSGRSDDLSNRNASIVFSTRESFDHAKVERPRGENRSADTVPLGISRLQQKKSTVSKEPQTRLSTIRNVADGNRLNKRNKQPAIGFRGSKLVNRYRLGSLLANREQRVRQKSSR